MNLDNSKLKNQIKTIPEGYSTIVYNDRKYGVSKSLFNAGKSTKVYAKELGGTDFISFNFYQTPHDHHLKPCEMREEKVTQFLKCYA